MLDLGGGMLDGDRMATYSTSPETIEVLFAQRVMAQKLLQDVSPKISD